MKLKLKEKSDKELQKMLLEIKEEVRKFNFSISGSGTKNVRKSRVAKRDIARILTELNNRKK
ncbi:MAG TPA: 50S ribosomal protein L29 [Candidatus Paceibacterota bacterium]|mgnify:CR=1 FL=1|nr:50S ribosomal protein L29 [Candidatus Paceibacterota bacterium]HMP19191.1 50S ribosomal protein L29 [Candidatus Paceibacterota bacterium]HMP85278.1 50S ribosomal protein L29 [Candidatus Paceibacterota bacterium]